MSEFKKSVAFVTLGCAKNEVDTRHMTTLLINDGYDVVDSPEDADIIAINTCAFITEATEESIATILDFAQDGKVLVVVGCLSSRYGKDVEAEFPEVSLFVPCADEENLAVRLDQLFACEEQPSQNVITQSNPMEYVKISDGCNRFCTYCVIPYIRGRYHSFPYESIYAEVEELVSSGAREIVLIAQDTGNWGCDFNPPLTTAWLINALCDAFPDTRFRLMYTEPEGITDELLEAVATHDNVCRYFDIPLQHVSPSILKAMHRSGSAAEFRDLVARIKTRIPDAALRTTFIVGFPGETEEDFEALQDFVEEGLFNYMGVFAYSAEEGTLAAELDNQVDEDIKQERLQTIRDLADMVGIAQVASAIGQTYPVLVEGYEEDGQLYGRTVFQAPEVDGVVYVDQGQPGEINLYTITDTLLYEMEGELA